MEDEIKNLMRIEDLLKCPMCGKDYIKVSEHSYKPDCNCVPYWKELRISIGWTDV